MDGWGLRIHRWVAEFVATALTHMATLIAFGMYPGDPFMVDAASSGWGWMVSTILLTTPRWMPTVFPTITLVEVLLRRKDLLTALAEWVAQFLGSLFGIALLMALLPESRWGGMMPQVATGVSLGKVTTAL